MFSFGFTMNDVLRIAWTFVQATLAYVLAALVDWVPGEAWDWRALAVGALAAGWAALKNGVLADSSSIK